MVELVKPLAKSVFVFTTVVPDAGGVAEVVTIYSNTVPVLVQLIVAPELVMLDIITLVGAPGQVKVVPLVVALKTVSTLLPFLALT